MALTFSPWLHGGIETLLKTSARQSKSAVQLTLHHHFILRQHPTFTVELRLLTVSRFLPRIKNNHDQRPTDNFRIHWSRVFQTLGCPDFNDDQRPTDNFRIHWSRVFQTLGCPDFNDRRHFNNFVVCENSSSLLVQIVYNRYKIHPLRVLQFPPRHHNAPLVPRKIKRLFELISKQRSAIYQHPSACLL